MDKLQSLKALRPKKELRPDELLFPDDLSPMKSNGWTIFENFTPKGGDRDSAIPPLRCLSARARLTMPKPALLGDQIVRPLGAQKSWARGPGTYISGRAYIDGADETAAEMEAKWGCDRLRLLVSPELREKFDRQRYLFNQAIWHGELEEVRREAGRMVNAWQALDRAAVAAGGEPLSPQVWELPLEDGTVAAIVPDDASARAVVGEGRKVSVFTLEEIGRLLSNYPDIAKAKLTFPGATITAVRRSVEDPLNAIQDTDEPLDDEIGF